VSKILIGKHQATIYPEGDGFTGAISLGFDGRGNRLRVKRKGKTKAAVKDKLSGRSKSLSWESRPARTTRSRMRSKIGWPPGQGT
jgi:hypothetical protein